VLAADRVSADGHFFNDLGASSLLMAMFSAAVRERGDLPPVSMKDIYLHPTVRLLAAAMGEPGPAREQAQRGPAGGPVPGPLRAPGAPPEAAPAARGVLAYALCGTLQLLAFAAYVAGFSLAVNAGAAWAVAGSGALAIYARLVVFGGGGLLAMGILPVLAKWLLIGRWKPRRIRAWGLAYFRFWLVKTLIVANPLARLFVGTPLYVLYLRALGARVGRRVVIFTQHVPVCTDLLTIGAGSVIRKDTYLSGYRARAGAIETGAVTIGAGVFIGEHTVLDIGTALGDGAQLGHASALLTGQAVPAGECWHGSPAEPAGPGDDYRTVGPARCGALRRAGYSLTRLLLVLAVAGPAAAAVISLLVSRPPLLAGALSRVDTAGWAARSAGRTRRPGAARRMLAVTLPYFSAPSWPGWSSPAPFPACSAAPGPGKVPCTGSITRSSAPSPGCRTSGSSMPCRGQLGDRAVPGSSATGWHRSSRPAPTSAWR
jgi:acetyltransferase-like isoleucine patch superfamily enzyme